MKIISITLFIVYLLFLFAVGIADGQTLYGDGNTPLVENGETIIHLPGGHQIRGGELTLKDVHGRGIADSKEPFTVQAEYEPETATHNVRARNYDDTIARWLSMDKKGHKPYVYTDNDPINFVDIDGNVKYSLWLYSNFGVTIVDGYHPDRPDTEPSIRKQVKDLTNAIEPRKLIKPLKRMSLESATPLGGGKLIDHITLTIHGSPTIVQYHHVRQRRIKNAKVDEFSEFFLHQLDIISPESRQTVETIFIDSCGVACNPSRRHWLERWQKPFLDKLAVRLRDELPNLKSITASPYQTSRVIDETPEGNLMKVGMFRFDDMAREKMGIIKSTMTVNDFVNGSIPPEFFELPSDNNLEFIGRRFGGGQSSSAHGVYSFIGKGQEDPRGINYLANDFKFNLPIFRKVQVRPTLPAIAE